MIRLPESRIENELGRFTRVAHTLGLNQDKVIGNSVFGQAGCEALQERGFRDIRGGRESAR